MEKLKKQKIWLCWKREPDENGRLTKKPYSPLGFRTGTSPDHSNEWVSYEEAQKAAEGYFDGIGFIIPEGYFFVDVDHQDAGSDLVLDLKHLMPTYMEISPSGNGLHFYGRCDAGKIPKGKREDGSLKLDEEYYSKNSSLGLEVYIGGLTSRFATYTGNERDLDGGTGVSVNECTQGLLGFLDAYMRRDRMEYSSEPIDPDAFETLTEDDIPEILDSLRRAKNGAKFIALFDNGEIPPGLSQSEADAALCALIAFRAGPNPDLINEIFMQSCLYRPKWDREDYWRPTVKAGIDACHGVFHHSVRKKPDFVFCDSKGRKYVSATRLAAYVKRTVRFLLVSEVKRGAYKKYVYRDGVYKLFSDDRFKGLLREAVESYDPDLVKMSVIDEAFKIISTDTNCVPITTLNDDEQYINFQNGLLDLESMELLPHSPDKYYTVQIGCKWKKHQIRTPTFDEYITVLTDGDAETQALLLEFMGAVISNVKGYRMKKALFMYGPGNTGKSQLKRLTEILLGEDNYSGIDLNQMEQRFGGGAIYGKRLTGTSDMGFMSVPELKLFKKATGGDTLFGEFKGQDGFEFVYGGLLWYCMNELPKFGGDDGQWVYDRILPVHCPNVMEESEQDHKLLDKMYAEREGIVQKAVMAFREVIRRGYRFTEPKKSKLNRTDYQTENNSALEFFHLAMVKRTEPIAKNDKYTVRGIYHVYTSWYNDTYGMAYRKSQKEFYKAISSYLGTDYEDMKIRHGSGLFLKDYTISEEACQRHGVEMPLVV